MTGLRRSATRATCVLVVGTAVMLGPHAAAAADVTIAVGAPASAEVGADVDVKAVVASDGQAVAGAFVVLTYEASFAGVDGQVVLDRATTDAAGVANLEYVQRAADNGEMRVEYVGPEDISVEPLVFQISVAPGGEQQHRSSAGVKIPFLNGSTLVAIIVLLWGALSYGAIQLVLVGRRGDGGVAHHDEGPLTGVEERGSAWAGTVLATAAVITAIGMVVVTLRNPLTHANLDSPGGYDRTPIAHFEQDFPYLGPGLGDAAPENSPGDAPLIWVRAGCATCHGLTAEGGAVGPDLFDLDSLASFMRDIRKGPDNMPAYTGEVLTDDQIEKLHGWLEDGLPFPSVVEPAEDG